MKKLVLLMMVLLAVCAAGFAQEHPKKTWNDGNIDYLPGGTKIRLQSLAVSSKPVTVYYTLDMGSMTEYTAPITLTEEGRHWIFYAGQDVFGKIGRIESYTAIVDTTPPELKYVLKGSSYVDADGVFYFTSDTGIMMQGEDVLSGLDEIYARFEGYDYDTVPVGEFIYLNGAPDGKYVVDGYLTDNVGNVSDTITAIAYLDNTAPEFNVTVTPDPIAIDGVSYIDPDAIFTITASDELSGVSAICFAIDDDNFMKYETNFRLPVEGNHTLKVFAVDNLGNVSDVSELPVRRDITLPSVSHEVELGL
jgi:hypothetical protein